MKSVDTFFIGEFSHVGVLNFIRLASVTKGPVMEGVQVLFLTF